MLSETSSFMDFATDGFCNCEVFVLILAQFFFSKAADIAAECLRFQDRRSPTCHYAVHDRRQTPDFMDFHATSHMCGISGSYQPRTCASEPQVRRFSDGTVAESVHRMVSAVRLHHGTSAPDRKCGFECAYGRSVSMASMEVHNLLTLSLSLADRK